MSNAKMEEQYQRRHLFFLKVKWLLFFSVETFSIVYRYLFFFYLFIYFEVTQQLVLKVLHVTNNVLELTRNARY